MVQQHRSATVGIREGGCKPNRAARQDWVRKSKIVSAISLQRTLLNVFQNLGQICQDEVMTNTLVIDVYLVAALECDRMKKLRRI